MNEQKKHNLMEKKSDVTLKGQEFVEKIVQIDRVTYVVGGGKRLRFRVLVVVGNKNGRVGYGLAKAQEVPRAIEKATRIAKKSLINAPIIQETIPNPIKIKYGSAVILLKPAPRGTSIMAGGAIRTVLELAGIKNVVSKMLGSSNKINNVKATIEALKRLEQYETKQSKIQEQKQD